MLKFTLNPVSLFSVILPFAYLITSIWAIDSGMTVLGFVKFLPLPLFLIALMQQENGDEEFFILIPPLAVAMTVISTILMQFPVLDEYFSVAGRLSGFFQYSNTFAMFLLVSLIIIGFKSKLKITDYIFMAVTIGGIIYSGSRTIMLLTIISIAVLIIFNTNKKSKLIISCIFGLLIAAAVIYAVLSGDFDDIGRFLRVSFTESSLLGRLLYFKDGIRMILKNPFGLGYLGYYYSQQSFQTGYYSVQFIHNDFLQLMLDVGIIPAIAFIGIVVYSFFKKGRTVRDRLLIFMLSAHSFFDFNLQFVSMLVLFLLILDNKDGKKIIFKHTAVISATAVVVTLTSIYFGIVQLLVFAGQYDKALKLYPLHTNAQINLLTAETNVSKMNERANSILEKNEYIAVAYSAKAKYAYSKGDFAAVVRHKNNVFYYAPYQIEDYNEYATMLIIGIQLYEQNGDSKSADYCKNELLKLPEMLEELKDKTDPLAFKLRDKPNFTLNAEITDYINRLG